MPLRIAVIGGGAAGFFSAISCKNHHPTAEVTLFEKTSKLLAKVKVSGGGRCNVTHACFENSQLVKFYPRGARQLKKSFQQFSTLDTISWFEKRGVAIKKESDGRMFPTTDDSQTIINCLVGEANSLGVKTRLNAYIKLFKRVKDRFELTLGNDIETFDKVIIATGGSPKLEGFDWLKKLGHSIVSPIPSLFTFNMPGDPVRSLMGLSVENATVRIQGTKLQHSGPLLITHWGMSGPAILKISAWGARVLKELNYQFVAQVNWLGAQTEEELRVRINEGVAEWGKRKIRNKNPFQLPQRLWEFLLEKVGQDPDQPWLELSKKAKNRLINILLNDTHDVRGKTTFKEEFVTCGGIDLSEIDFNTMQSRKVKGLYFAGEVMDVDGVTGGFNFQAAWTTGYIAGKLTDV